MSDHEELFNKAMEALGNGDIDGVDMLRQAAEMGNAYAQNNYAMILYAGDLVDRDVEGAFNWFKAAAEGGIDESQFHLGLEFYEGNMVDKDYREALKWFRVSAEKGYPPAQYYLGLCYYHGYGVFKDYGFAVNWFSLASAREYSPATIALADAFMDLNNPERNYKEAFRLYRRAAESGNDRGYYKLGICYYKGKGTPRNFIEASKSFRKGMDISDNTDCQYMLGLMYIKGEGVQKNYSTGIMMIRDAAKNGNKDAIKYLKIVASTERFPGMSEMSEMNTEEPNTPDLIGGRKGAEQTWGILSFFKRRM